MRNSNLYLGDNQIATEIKKVKGQYVEKDDEKYYCIENVNEMPPFFISLVSGNNHWLFASSRGGLTAGRQQAEHCLFPYTTDDKIHDNSGITGSKSLFIVTKNEKRYLWEPFSEEQRGLYVTTENLYKNTLGDKLIYESTNHDLGVKFEYAWQFSHRFGIVKKSQLTNLNASEIQVEMVDGLQNIMPANVDLGLQTSRSNLVDAYKKGELAEGKLGIFSLSANIVDKAEPSESLLATTVWTAGFPIQKQFLNVSPLHALKRGVPIPHQEEALGGRCAYFCYGTTALHPNQPIAWITVADVQQRHTQIKETLTFLQQPEVIIINAVHENVIAGSLKLERNIGMADGHQLTNDALASYRHYSNTLFNCMRGGVFIHNYQINVADYTAYVAQANYGIHRKHTSFFKTLPKDIQYANLLERVKRIDDADLNRLTLEYLPLSYSRRHGDPSRPWNTFHIEIENSDGSDKFYYEGNWRDIFQNWEALGYSFPLFFESFIAKFLNASTIDGYNPYRITRNGIDWEVIEEDDPWSFIGYWGDHQIIYLQKLLEGLERHFPGKLATLLNQRNFVFANVPYRLRDFSAIRKDPQSTIDFDFEIANQIEARSAAIGADGKLVHDGSGMVLKASLLEKVLTSVLTKLYNYIPDAGIWMNTQRPEWNDANNALVGNGVSMVTLYYLRRHLAFFSKIVAQYQGNSFDINRPLYDLLKELHDIFNNIARQNTITDAARYTYVEALGIAGETYRNAVYEEKTHVIRKTSITRIRQFIAVAQNVTEQCIAKNKRTDGLYHSYNLVDFQAHQAPISRLYKMLEGQVAAISSLALPPEAVSHVLDSLKNSNLYREDQYSYLLYPNRKLPSFLQKNTIESHPFLQSQLVERLLKEKNYSLVERANDGSYHFNAKIKNNRDLIDVLEKLSVEGFKMEVMLAHDQALEAYEDTFNHRAFTGRSGTFYGYEGLGSIYWHMVSKLLLSIQEVLYQFEIDDQKVKGNLIAHYYEIRAGIGINKAPDLYGAFPTDPYSHTPANQGVKQPGMTGQVKEDILNRWAELGVQVSNGCVTFVPKLLRKSEFLQQSGILFVAKGQQDNGFKFIVENELGFSYCGVPIVYQLAETNQLEITLEEGALQLDGTLQLPKDISEDLFERNGRIATIKVSLRAGDLL